MNAHLLVGKADGTGFVLVTMDYTNVPDCIMCGSEAIGLALSRLGMAQGETCVLAVVRDERWMVVGDGHTPQDYHRLFSIDPISVPSAEAVPAPKEEIPK